MSGGTSLTHEGREGLLSRISFENPPSLSEASNDGTVALVDKADSWVGAYRVPFRLAPNTNIAASPIIKAGPVK